MRRQNLYRLLRREWPHAVLAARGTVAAVAALQWRLLLPGTSNPLTQGAIWRRIGSARVISVG